MIEKPSDVVEDEAWPGSVVAEGGGRLRRGVPMAKEEELVTENTGLQVSSKAYRAASKGGKEGELSENWCLKVVLAGGGA
jgi:hypothetical protein